MPRKGRKPNKDRNNSPEKDQDMIRKAENQEHNDQKAPMDIPPPPTENEEKQQIHHKAALPGPRSSRFR